MSSKLDRRQKQSTSFKDSYAKFWFEKNSWGTINVKLSKIFFPGRIEFVQVSGWATGMGYLDRYLVKWEFGLSSIFALLLLLCVWTYFS